MKLRITCPYDAPEPEFTEGAEGTLTHRLTYCDET